MVNQAARRSIVNRKVSNGHFQFKWIAILLAVVLIFVFFAFFAKNFGKTSLKVDLKGKTVAIETDQLRLSSEQITKFDPNQYYIDSGRGFSFQPPTSQGWSKPTFFSGIKSLQEAKGITLSPQNQEQFRQGLAMHPLGLMVESVEGLRIVSGESIELCRFSKFCHLFSLNSVTLG